MRRVRLRARSVTTTSNVEPSLSGDQALRAHIGLRREAVGDDAMVRQARDHLLHRGMVDAQHREAIERNVRNELVVAGDHRLGGAPVIEMLRVHIGDDGDDRRQPQKAAVAFVGLHHHPVAAAQRVLVP